jgi:hypothetical protein
LHKTHIHFILNSIYFFNFFIDNKSIKFTLCGYYCISKAAHLTLYVCTI